MSTTALATRGRQQVQVSDHSDIIVGVTLDATAGGPLVGRDVDVDRLTGLLGLDQPPGGGGMVVLSGDAGIGKTRVLSELAGRARDGGWRVLVGHCLGEAGSSLPYLPFTEMLGRLEGVQGEAIDEVVAAHPHLARLLPGRRRGDLGVADETLARGDLVEAVHAALEDLARRGPVLVVVEDVHWADQSSRDLLTLLFTRGFSGPVSLIASYRSDDLHRRHPLRATLANWSRLADVRRVDLAPLADRDVRELVKGLPSAPLPEADVQAVVERAEGNAFFAEELVAASALGRPGAAEDLSRLLLVRFDQLSPSGQQVARLAAAAGRQVSHRLISTVAGLPLGELDDALRDAVEHHVLVPTESGGYAFRHALLAETVYDDLLPGERVRAHERYAQALSKDPSLGTWADLARHALAAGDRDQALTASIRAGDAAMGVGGPDEALRHFEQALALLPDDHPDTDGVTLRAAAAATSVGGSLKAVDLLQDRLARRPADGDPARRAELLAELATTARVTESTLDTLAITKEALELVPADEPSTLRARLLAAHFQALADRSRDEEATRAAEEAIATAERVGLRSVVDEVQVILARIVERNGEPEESRETLERILDERSVQGTPAELRALHHLGSLHHRAGRLAEAVEVYLRGAEKARVSGLEWAPYALDSRLLGGIAAYEVGDWDLATRVLDLEAETPPQPAKALLVGARMYVAGARGDAGVLAALPEVRRWWEAEGLAAVLAGSAAIDLYGNTGDIAKAIAAHDDAVALLTRLWHPRFQAQLRFSGLLLGQLATYAERASSAERSDYLRRGETAAETAALVWAEVDVPGSNGPEAVAWEARARAEWLRLRWLAGAPDPDLGAMASAWREAVERFDAYGHRYETARSRARLAAVLHAAGDAEADGLAREAAAVARSLRAEPLLVELRPLLSGPAQPRGSADRLGESLTPREQEILSLVALGRSNKQIGTQLFISAKTASVHVSNIMAKLGAAGRGEAVAVARERGLLP